MIEDGEVRIGAYICEVVRIYLQFGGIYGPSSDTLALSEIMDE